MIYLYHEIQSSDRVRLLFQKDNEVPCYWISSSFNNLVTAISEISNTIISQRVYDATLTNSVTLRSQRFVINYCDEIQLSEELKLWLVTTFWQKNFRSFSYNFQSAKIEIPNLLEGL